LTYTYTEKLQ